MPDSSDVVDRYLSDRFSIGLEQVIVEASKGALPAILAGAVEVSLNQRGRYDYADRGQAFHYEGSIIVEGVTYWFRTWIYQEVDGGRFMTDLSEFAAYDWRIPIRIGDVTER